MLYVCVYVDPLYCFDDFIIIFFWNQWFGDTGGSGGRPVPTSSNKVFSKRRKKKFDLTALCGLPLSLHVFESSFV